MCDTFYKGGCTIRHLQPACNRLLMYGLTRLPPCPLAVCLLLFSSLQQPYCAVPVPAEGVMGDGISGDLSIVLNAVTVHVQLSRIHIPPSSGTSWILSVYRPAAYHGLLGTHRTQNTLHAHLVGSCSSLQSLDTEHMLGCVVQNLCQVQYLSRGAEKHRYVRFKTVRVN